MPMKKCDLAGGGRGLGGDGGHDGGRTKERPMHQGFIPRNCRTPKHFKVIFYRAFPILMMVMVEYFIFVLSS